MTIPRRKEGPPLTLEDRRDRMSALADEIRAAVREALREELPRALAELQQRAPKAAEDLVDVAGAAPRLGLAVGTLYKMAEKVDLTTV